MTDDRAQFGQGGSLLDLPYYTLIDSLLCSPALSARDLANLRLVSRAFKGLVDDELVWRRRITDDFNFPEHASARIQGWQQLYRGLARPTAFVWGQAENCRLGIPPRDLREELRVLVSKHRGAPFPLELDYRTASASASSGETNGERATGAVEIVAGGWSFHALTTTGDVLFWGQLDGLSSPRIESPQILKRATKSPVKSLSAGRSHVVALTSDQEVLEWHDWDLAVAHEPFLELARQDRKTSIAQVEAGWDFSVALLHSQRPGETAATTSEVIYWHSIWVTQEATQNDAGERGATWEGLRRITLPELPAVTQEVGDEIGATSGSPQLITRIAAGENWIIALTQAGLLYKIDTATLAADGPNLHRVAGGLTWSLLEKFCLPSKMAQLEATQEGSALAGLVRPDLRITHINAQFRSFVAYTPAVSVDAQSDNDGDHDAQSQGGIVLLGNGESKFDSDPIVKPQLQGAGVIKVSMGDWHYGALTASGKVMTWGSWSRGALGTWDSLPFYESPGDALPRFAANRGDAGGSTRVGPTPTLHHRVPQGDATQALPGPRLRGRGRLGLAGARLARQQFREAAQDQAGPSPTPRPRAEDGPESDASEHSHSQDSQDPWELRLRARRVPQKIEEPTLLQFDPSRPDRHFVFDIAFAGWHSAALAIDYDFLNPSDGGQHDQQEATPTAFNPSSFPSVRDFQSPPERRDASTTTRGLASARGSRGLASDRSRGRIEFNPSSFDADTEILAAIAAHERARRIRSCSLLFLFLGILALLGLGGGETVDGDDEDTLFGRTSWFFALETFLPLVIPLGLYFVIARWTGQSLWEGAGIGVGVAGAP